MTDYTKHLFVKHGLNTDNALSGRVIAITGINIIGSVLASAHPAAIKPEAPTTLSHRAV